MTAGAIALLRCTDGAPLVPVRSRATRLAMNRFASLATALGEVAVLRYAGGCGALLVLTTRLKMDRFALLATAIGEAGFLR